MYIWKKMVIFKYIKSERRNRKWDVKGLNFIIKKYM